MSWRKFGGKNIVLNDTVNVGTVVANQFLTRTTLSTTNTFDNVNILGEAIIHHNAYLKEDLFVDRNEFISNNLYVKNKIMLGIDISNNIDPYAYIAGNRYNIGMNTMNPSTVFHVTGSNTNILTVDTDSAVIRNIIGQNVNQKGVVIQTEDVYSNIYFYNDSTTSQDNQPNAFLRYQMGGYLTLSTQTAIDLSATNITSRFGKGSMHFDENNALINTPGNLLFNSQNVFINSTQNFLFTYSPYSLPNSALLLNPSGILFNTVNDFYVNAPGGTISSVYNNSSKIGTVTISTNLTELSSNTVMSTSGVYKSIYNETLTVYDSSNSIYLFNVFDNSAAYTGSAITAVAQDNSSNTQIKLVTPNGSGLSLIGGKFPNDTSRSMASVMLLNGNTTSVPAYTILSGNSLQKYYSTVGINTYKPKTERYSLDINGPTRIGNGEINNAINVDFEIKMMKFSKIAPLSGIAVGTPNTIFGATNVYNEYILYSKDGGITWKMSNSGLQGLSVISNDTITSLYVYDQSFAMIGTVQNNLLYSYDGGINWISMVYNVNEPSRYQGINGFYNRTTNSITINKTPSTSNYNIFSYYTYTNPGNSTVPNVKYNNNYLICYSNLSPTLFSSLSNVQLVKQGAAAPNGDNSPLSYTINDSDAGNYYAYFAGSIINQIQISSGVSASHINNNNSVYNGIYVYDDDHVVAVGNNIISWTINGTSTSGSTITSTWYDSIPSTTIGAMNLRSVYVYDLSRAVAVGDKGVFIYTNNWSQANSWLIVPPTLLNSSGISDRILEANLRGIHMYDINTFVIANANQSYNPAVKQLGESQILYCYFPNIFNRVNNGVFDVSGNMYISGDININDSGQIYSNNPTFNVLNNSIVKEIYLGSNSANTAINGNLYVGNDVSFNSRLFVYGDASYNSNVGLLGNLTIFRGKTIFSNNYDINTAFMPNSNISIGYSASNIYIGKDTIGGKTITLGTGGPMGSGATFAVTSSINNIYIGAPNDNIVLYGNTQIINVTQTQFAIPLLKLNTAQFGPFANTGTTSIIKGSEILGAGITIKDMSNNNAGYMVVSNDTSGYYFKATGSDNTVNLNVGTLQWPPGFPTQLNISNNIQNGILVLSKDTNIQNRAYYGITVKPIDISNVFLRDGTPTSTNTYQQIATNVGVSGDLTVMLNNRLFVYCDTSLNSRLLVYSDVSLSSRLFVSADTSMNGNLYVANSVCIDTSGNQSLYNLDVSGSSNFRGTTNAINLIDNSVLMSNTPTIDFSNNFCMKWMQNVIAPSNSWGSVEMSTNGQFQTALIKNNISNASGIYTSTDYGVNWYQIPYNAITPYSGGTVYNWTSLAMSATGQIQVATFGFYLFISQNYGNTWAKSTALSATSNLYACAISSNGQFISVVAFGFSTAYIYISSNGGTTFTNPKQISATINTINSNQCSITTSSTGQYQVCCLNLNTTYATGPTTYVSNNYGYFWTPVPLTNNDYLNSVSISSSGQYSCIARCSGGSSASLFFSNNYGASYSAVGPQSPTYQWNSVGVSANGQNIIAVGNGCMLSSVNYGAGWSQGTAPTVATNWQSVAISANGQYIISTINGGFIYNSVTPYVNMSISNNLIVYRDVSFNARVFIGGPVFQF